MSYCTLYTANCAGVPQNTIYPNAVEITGLEDLKKAARFDYTAGRFKDNRRSIDNFLDADCVLMDVDNDHADDAISWINPFAVQLRLTGVMFFAVPSRNHLKPKGTKEPREKWHFIFPYRSRVSDPDQQNENSRKLRYVNPEADDNAEDAARFFFASGDNADLAVFVDGDLCIDEYFEQHPDIIPMPKKGEITHTGAIAADNDEILLPEVKSGSEGSRRAGNTIPEGERNSQMFDIALRLLTRFGSGPATVKEFLKQSRRCDPPLPQNELNSILQSAIKTFVNKIQNDPSYMEPTVYNNALTELKAIAADAYNDLVPSDMSNVAQAAVYARFFRNKVKYSPATGWMFYNGRVWRESNAGAQYLLQQLTNKQLDHANTRVSAAWEKYGQAVIQKAQGNPMSDVEYKGELIPAEKYLKESAKAEEKYRDFILRCRNGSSIGYTLTQASSQPCLYFSSEDVDKVLDPDPFLLNTPSGSFDLRTGEVRENSPDDMCTKITAVSPSKDGVDQWLEFLETITGNDEQLQSYLQLVVGKAAIGRVFEENITIAYGHGANGKSTFFNAVFAVMGDYSGKISADILTQESRINPRAELANLRGKRYVLAAELGEDKRLDSATLKAIASTDQISAEQKYKDPFFFKPSHTILLFTNHLPKVNTNDHGTWKRLTVVPFTQRISGEKEIKNYAEVLIEHSGGAILSWIIEGAQRFIMNGCKITDPECIREATEQYKRDNDTINQFIDDCCIVESGAMANCKTLYEEYTRFCEQNGQLAMSKRVFKETLEDNGHKEQRTMHGRYYSRIKLKVTS